MDQIYLTRQEKRFLTYLRFVKKIQPGFDVSHLVKCGLIRRNYSDKKNEIGMFIPENTYSLTDYERRWRIAKRQDRWQRIVTPITVTILTDAVIHAIRQLLQWIESLP